MTSTADIQRNLDIILDMVGRAGREGCAVVSFPENALFLGSSSGRLRGRQDPLLQQICQAARDASVAVLLGTVEEASSDDVRSLNSLLWIDPSGALQCAYSKIHLFDVPSLGLVESNKAVPGSDPVVTASLGPDGIQCGLTICYDLRFPAMYQKLAETVRIIFAPSAFTVKTGRAHWRILLQCRAVETQCFVVAPAQVGIHNEAGRETYGDSCIVDPWGVVVASVATESPHLLVHDCDLNFQDQVRANMPLLQHRVSVDRFQ